MEITDVTTTILHDPDGRQLQDSTVPKLWAGGGTDIFVHIKTDEGLEGLGVGQARPPHAIREIIERELKDLFIGEDPFNIEKLWNDMFWRMRNYARKGVALQALSSIDIALWDLKARALGLPLYRLLNPRYESVPVYGSGGWTNMTEEELVEEALGFVERGIPRYKMKVGKDFGNAEREDVQRVAAVRKAVGDDVEIYVDANMGYNVKQAIRMSHKFEDYDVRWFEEPILADNVEGFAQISRATQIPIATGENEYTRHGFKELIVHGGVDIVQPDVGRVGGVTEWMKVASLADSFGLSIAPHGVPNVHLQLCMAIPNLKVVEYFAGGWVTVGRTGFFTEVPVPVDGMWAPFPDKPGLGFELDPDAVKKYSVN
ncbi:MAG: mandelate racemase/muconate lactonizing enzyme family protein [Chloroflexi bacterium]|nr:mandelate racemase/muconate lactonizing enzyme family protein [Chloroflexota bacterium]MCI0775344.1 mandelate racemase/muconate lactonizing enzyme family protein [Chloroflexota bacterium]MCI0808163.1 mandelate racemase/muconate lactonizing enzyme family protein [Chloroflexota bacterium]MCI0834827.1 mandelate racemase/muconate lactonizing enzyme family protein [Chloroflexota bacterium]MCI0852759.1 mandelate racemase/muconate lactonizing enzyme family protein [Chloroflexota bacterium]